MVRCRLLAPVLLLLVALLATARGGAAADATVTLHIDDPCDPATLTVRAEPTALRPVGADAWLVTGHLAMPDFAVASVAHLKLQDAEGHAIPLFVETGTLYREFDVIVGVKIAFELDPRALAKGLPTLTWGDTVTGDTRSVPAFVFAPEATPRVRAFTVQRTTAASEAARVATIAIIADSHADRYYLWYLLPMLVIFILLVVRKQWSH